MSTICLASNDPDPSGRIKLLDAANREYQWDHSFLPNYALLYEPGTEHPNIIQAIAEGHFNDLPEAEIPERGSAYIEMRKDTGLPGITRFVRERIGDFFHHLIGDKDIETPSSYAKFIETEPEPTAVQEWRNDAFFTWQRLAGPNPVMLTRLDQPPTDFAIDDSRLPEGQSLEALAKAGSLYLCDYAILEGLPSQSYKGQTIHAPASKSLFAVIDGELQPIAIQVDQAAASSHVFTPADGHAWTMAKLCAQTADLNVHEIVVHLARTHFTLEGVAVATSRALPTRHPVFNLLWQHLRYLIFNNFEGRELLVNETGWATELLAGGKEGIAGLLERSRLGYPEREVAPWHIDNWHLPTELASRGVDDAAKLPNYPYRDDGLLIWKAIGGFAREYVEHYYDSDEAITGDAEVQDWAHQLSSPSGAGLPGVASSLSNREALADLIHRIIWAAGPLHCAVNYPQYDFMVFVPNMPAGLYDDPWQRSGEIDEASIMKMLPPEHQATLQVFTVTELTSFHYDRLGHYPNDAFPAEVMPVITRFQGALDDAGSTIKANDEKRRWKYPYLHPEQILNSTSI